MSEVTFPKLNKAQQMYRALGSAAATNAPDSVVMSAT